MQAWDVYIGNRCIDTVFYTRECSMTYVRHTLINHDGYPANIVLVRN